MFNQEQEFRFLQGHLYGLEIAIEVESPEEASSTLHKLFNLDFAILDGCNIIRESPPLSKLTDVVAILAKANGTIDLVFGYDNNAVRQTRDVDHKITFDQFISENIPDDHLVDEIEFTVMLEARRNRLCYLMENMWREIELEDISNLDESKIEAIEGLFSVLQGRQKMPKIQEQAKPESESESRLSYSNFSSLHSASVIEESLPTQTNRLPYITPEGKFPYPRGRYFFINDGTNQGIYVVNLWYENMKYLIDNGALTDTINAVVFTSNKGVKCAYIIDDRVPDNALHAPVFGGSLVNPDVLRFHTSCPEGLCICEHDYKSAIHWSTLSYNDVNNEPTNYPICKSGYCVECSKRFSWVGDGVKEDSGTLTRH